MNEETALQNRMLADLGMRPDVLAWRNHVGVFRSFDDADRVVKIGQPGAADILAVVAVTITPDMVGQVWGRAVAIEAKTARGRQTERQRNWAAAFEQRGGVYTVARTVAEERRAIALVQSAGFSN